MHLSFPPRALSLSLARAHTSSPLLLTPPFGSSPSHATIFLSLFLLVKLLLLRFLRFMHNKYWRGRGAIMETVSDLPASARRSRIRRRRRRMVRAHSIPFPRQRRSLHPQSTKQQGSPTGPARIASFESGCEREKGAATSASGHATLMGSTPEALVSLEPSCPVSFFPTAKMEPSSVGIEQAPRERMRVGRGGVLQRVLQIATSGARAEPKRTNARNW